MVSVGNGYRPTIHEYNDEMEKIIGEANGAIRGYPDFYNWTLEERNYMVVKEQAFVIARRFGWLLQGGSIDE